MTNVETRLYIFDADGTLRWTTVEGQKYPTRSGEWRLMPNVRQRLAGIPWSAAGPWLAVASNQNGVAEGLLDEPTARRLIQYMLVEALGRVPERTSVELCVCSEQAGCDCRKPAPGLLLRLLRAHRISPAEALFVGDLPIDAEAARRAGIPFVWAHDFFGT
ncbi:MAG: HAD-IIIA family hydrolase [Hyphomicrobiaceae bacterium]|nr:HAD-IIIA family hydrolase [Hyphomicrobiaceae bacterium]